jgi:hypothetical protein
VKNEEGDERWNRSERGQTGDKLSKGLQDAAS